MRRRLARRRLPHHPRRGLLEQLPDAGDQVQHALFGAGRFLPQTADRFQRLVYRRRRLRFALLQAALEGLPDALDGPVDGLLRATLQLVFQGLHAGFQQGRILQGLLQVGRAIRCAGFQIVDFGGEFGFERKSQPGDGRIDPGGNIFRRPLRP